VHPELQAEGFRIVGNRVAVALALAAAVQLAIPDTPFATKEKKTT
jgi:hypothetical protein